MKPDYVLVTVDTFKTIACTRIGWSQKRDVITYDSLEAAAASATEIAKDCCQSIPVLCVEKHKDFPSRPGVNGDWYKEINGSWYTIGQADWDVITLKSAEKPDLLDTDCPIAVGNWCEKNRQPPEKEWGAVERILTEKWKCDPLPHSNVIDMQFDCPGWRPDGTTIVYLLKDGSFYVTGSRGANGLMRGEIATWYTEKLKKKGLITLE